MKKRVTDRQRTYTGGRINFGNAPGIDCVIRNLSEKGACLDVESELITQDRIGLIVKPDNRLRTCEVAWRKPHKIGVRFV